MRAAAESAAARYDVRLLPAAAGAWMCCAAGLFGGTRVSGLLVVACGGGAVVALGWACRGLAGRRRAVALTVCGALVAAAGVTAGLWVRQSALAAHPLRHSAPDTSWRVALTVRDDPQRAGGALIVRGQVFAGWPTTEAVRPYSGGTFRRAAIVIFANDSEWADIVPGQQVSATVTLRAARARDLVVAVGIARSPPETIAPAPLMQRVASGVRGTFAAVCAAALPPRWAALLPGLVIGDTSAQDPLLASDFRDSGLAHLTAVSGGNFAVVIVAVTALLTAVGCGPRLRMVLVIVTIVAFVVLVRPSPSVIRAALMGGLGALALVSGRRPSALAALAAAVVLALGVWPQLAVAPGFILSVAATAALIVVAPRWSLTLVQRGLPVPVAQVVAVAAAASVVTAPLVMLLLGAVNPLSVLANIAVAAVIPPLTMLGLAAVVLAAWAPLVAQIVVRCCVPFLWWLDTVATVTARHRNLVPPWVVLGVGLGVLGLAAMHDWKRRRAGRHEM